jgi:hypothetical protein
MSPATANTVQDKGTPAAAGRSPHTAVNGATAIKAAAAAGGGGKHLSASHAKQHQQQQQQQRHKKQRRQQSPWKPEEAAAK